MKKLFSRQSGFTLVETAILVMVMGLVVGAIFSFLPGQRNERAEEITKAREQKIANALAYYAQQKFSLPCPSLPFVATIPGDPVPTCNTVADRTGTLPYRLLGLSQADIVDGFGNPFSYTVSATAAAPDTTNVESAFRMPTWMNVAGTQNLNKKKAAFCGSHVSSEVMYVESGSSTSVFDATDTQSRPLVSGTFDWGDADTKALSTKQGQPDYHIDYYAYVLVSHGKDGMGSFTFCPGNPASCSNARKAVAPPGTFEAINANPSDTFYKLMNSDSKDSNHFDDIVLWRTQNGVIEEFNNDSCASPYPTSF